MSKNNKQQLVLFWSSVVVLALVLAQILWITFPPAYCLPGLKLPSVGKESGAQKTSTTATATTTSYANLAASSTLYEVYEYNQRTRRSVTEWIKREDWETPPSVVRYGLLARVYDKVNLDVGTRPIGHDAIGFFALQLKKRIVYLEIGVSVGKCLYSQLNLLSPPSIVYAFDLEDINPTLAGFLEYKGTKKTWRDDRQDRKKNRTVDDSIKVFAGKQSGTHLIYMASDEFSNKAWEHLSQEYEKFNLIYSDAQHSSKALIAETTKLLSLSLVDLAGGYTVVWDDCSSNLQRTFMTRLLPAYRNATSAARTSADYVRSEVNSNFCFGVFAIPGWLGDNEEDHGTCIVSTTHLEAIVGSDQTLANLVWVDPVKCDGGGL